MKKIYMILAAMTLLSLSLNAQTTYYQKVTTTADLTDGAEYLIVCENQGVIFDGSLSNLNSTNYYAVTPDNGVIAYSAELDAKDFTITASGTYYDIKSASGYYIGITSTSNAISYSANAYDDKNTITVTDGVASISVKLDNATRPLKCNSSNKCFRYYKSTSGDVDDIQLYKKIGGSTPTAELTAPVNGSTVNVGTNTGNGVSKTINIKGSNLTQDLTVSVSGTGFNVTRDATITAAEANAGHDITVTYNGTDASATGTLSITSSEVNTTINLTASYNAGGSTSGGEGTIGNGATTNTYLPAAGYYQDYGYKNQMIYTAAQLADIGIQEGDLITSITFYPTTYSSYFSTVSGINFSGSQVTLSLGNTQVSTFSGQKITPDDLTDMVTISPVVDTNATEWTFSWNTGFEYKGGNLLVQVYCPGYSASYGNVGPTGTYGDSYFKGDTQTSNVSIYSTGNSTTGTSGTNSTFQPQATFTFEGSNSPKLIDPANGSTVNVGESLNGASVSKTITVSGQNLTEDLTVSVTGTGYSVSPTTLSAADVNAGTATVTVTYSNGNPSATTGTLTIGSSEASTTVNLTVTYVDTTPSLTAPVDGTTVDVGTNNGMGVSKTIAVSGTYLTEDLTVSVSGAGFTVSPTTLRADAVNNGTATVTVTYNGTTDATGTLTISSGEVSTTVNLTGSYSTGIAPTAHGMVRMGTLRIVDQFAEKIPATNDHPYRYTYFLKLATRDTTSSPARVPVQHTGAEMNGYYTHAEMKGDTDPANFLTEDMLSAEVEMNLSPSSAPYFYTINSVKNGVPASVTSDEHYDSYISVMQRREAGDYQEMQYGSPYLNNIKPAGKYDFFDFRAIQAESKDDSLSYVPIVWTKGIDRHYYVDDSLHNSYGAPIWEVRTGDVMIDQSGTVCQRQVASNGGWNSTVNYTVDGTDYSLYLVSVNAQGILPISNVEYEPYMFRLWLYDDNASLRNYTWMENDNWTKIEDAGAYTDNGGKWKLLDTYMCENWGGENGDQYDPDLNYVVNINPGTSANPQSWQNNIGFVAPIQGFTPKLYVRFYYKIKGSVDPNTSGMRGAGDEDNVGYVVLRGVNPDPGTGVYEIVVNGEVESQIFYNVQGMQSDKPFPGINIVVTRYSNGATTTTKVRY